MKLKQLVFLLLIGKIGFSQSIVIKFNEYSCSNINTIADPLGTMGLPSYSPDWIELRNMSLISHTNTAYVAQQLSGIYLSDDRYNLHKWQFPYYNNLPIKLDSGQSQIIFLCGHDKVKPGTPGIDTFAIGSAAVSLHANFQLNQTKRGANGKLMLYLTKSVNATTPYDSVDIRISKPGHSWGKCWERQFYSPSCPTCVLGYQSTPYKTWFLYPSPTPGKANPRWPAYYTDYLPKPKFDLVPGYYGALNNIQISDTSGLSSTGPGGYVNYPSLCIIATNDCTSPDTFNTVTPLTATIVAQGSTLGTPLTGAFNIVATSTVTPTPPTPSGYMIRAVMHDGSYLQPNPLPSNTVIPTYTNTPRYMDSFETYGAYYDSLYKIPLTFVCIDTSSLFLGAANDTSGSTIDYFDKTGKELMRNQGLSTINGIDFFNPLGPSNMKKQWQFYFSAEDEYGYSYTTPYQFFQDPIVGPSARADFPHLMFRAGSEESFLYSSNLGGNQFPAAHVRDYFNHTMTMRHKLDFETMHYTPTYMMINGMNKGIYYIKEPFDSAYTDYYFQRPKAAILANGVITGVTPPSSTQFNVIPYSGFASTGGNALFRWNAFYSWAMNTTTNVHIPALYYQVSDSVDFLSLNDYTIYNMFSVNADYLKRSAMWWRGLPNDTSDHREAKWRFALANTDVTWGFNENDYNGISDNSPSSSPCDFMNAFGLYYPPSLNVSANNAYPLMALWNKLMANDTFKNGFLSRYEDLLNGALSCDSLEDHFKYIRSQLYASDMASHVWWLLADNVNFPTYDSVHYWNLALDSMSSFLTQRCSTVTEGLKSCFNLQGPFNLCVDVEPKNSGNVLLNSIQLNAANYVWNGKYLDSVTMIAHATPEKNYVFDHWETSPLQTYTLHPDNKSDSINFFVSTDLCIKAVFKLKPADQTYGDPMVPSGFSPNGDGNNDIFNMYGIAEATVYELEVYNRWGELIYRSIDKAKGWDGVYNGVPVPVGVYAYRYNVVVNGKTFKNKGSVTVLR